MIQIKNKLSVQKMSTAGKLLSEVLDAIESKVVAGVTTLEIDTEIEALLRQRGLVSKTKGYKGYQHSCCVSVNDEVVHGVPSEQKKLQNGDLVKVDVCASFNGYCADMARCFFVGEPHSEIKKMVEAAQSALDKGIEQAKPGNRLGDISAAIQREVERHGFGVVRDFAGHGIGKQMHEDPEVLNYGKAGTGIVLRPGMALAIEPMITFGSYKVYVDKDGWTVKTVDKSFAAHVEDTVVITQHGPQILTR
jgi:methionyl aminopeptidase